MGEVSEAPISLQRNCATYFKIRGAAGVPGEIINTDLAELAKTARTLLGQGRVWIDLYMDYTAHAANAEAINRSGRTSVRLDSWEVFPDDLIYCPAGTARLDPRWYALAEAAQS